MESTLLSRQRHGRSGAKPEDSAVTTLVQRCIETPELTAAPPVVVPDAGDSTAELMELLRRAEQPMMNYTYGRTAAWSKPDPRATPGWLAASVESDLGDVASVIPSIADVEDPSAIVERHVGVLCELSGYDPGPRAFSGLCVLYAYICAYFNLRDAHCDGHIRTKGGILDAGPFLAAAFEQLENVCGGLDPAKRRSLRSELTATVVRQRNALLLERQYQQDPLVPAEHAEKASIAGRAGYVPFAYELTSMLAGSPPSPITLGAIEEYLYWAQLADDLGDWREDYRNKHYTSFVRRCFSELGYVADERTLERTVYLGGEYERRLVSVMRGVDAIGQGPGGGLLALPLLRDAMLEERRMFVSAFKAMLEPKVRFHDALERR